ncbi:MULTISPECIES: histidine kinase [Curtobacterium]|uniref:sensor histidine kinase n=1 Tax=Curtobacterium flaccumfaciens TaxID=2035 RepID=UPI003EE5CF73
MDRITAHRNWGLHVAVAVTIALVAVIAVLAWSPWSTRWPAFAMLAVLAAAYLAYGWRGYESPRAAAGFVPLLVVAALVLPAVVPTTAFVQCMLFPVAWCQLDRVRPAILVSLAIGVASGVGLQIATGPTGLVSTLLVEAVSVVGACALGLWITRIAELSDERRQLIDELRATQDSLAEAHRRAGVTSERERLARELHDTVAQNLAGIVMLTERARGDLAADRVDRLDERLTILEESARAALEESRTLVAAGSAGIAGDGLAAALHRLGERFTRETGVPVAVTAADCVLDRDTQVVLLRTAQEALANFRAHADAASVHVALHVAADRATLRVEDDGVGFDPAVPSPGHGLRGLRERLALAGGTCTIVSAPGHGTVVVVELPTGVAPNVPGIPSADLPVGSAFSAVVGADLAPNPITGAAQ